MNTSTAKLSLIAIAVSSALVACGGGGGDSTPAATTPTPIAVTPPSAGDAPTSTPNVDIPAPVVTPGVTTPPVLPPKNETTIAVPTTNYSGETAAAWDSIQTWRNSLRNEAEGNGGVGVLTQRAALDTIAAAIAAGGAAPTSISGYPVFFTATTSTNNPFGVSPGAFCAKSMFANLNFLEYVTSGMRDGGAAISGTTCTLVAGLDSVDNWQLPPTASSSVYPYPGKTLALTRFQGDYQSWGLPASPAPGHPVFVSVASADALPVAIAGVGTGQPIATSSITLNSFSLSITGGAVVPSRIIVPTGVVAGSGVTATTSALFRYPTSMALVPLAALAPDTKYTATFNATVNGRAVTRTWEFTSASN